MSNDSSAPDGARRAAEPDAESTVAPARRAANGQSFSGALGWTALGAIVPGLGLWRAGRRVAGGILIGLFVVIVGGLGVLYVTNRNAVESAVLAPGTLQNIAIGLIVVALAWVAVIGISHLALRPANASTGQRAAGAAVVGVLSFVVAAPMAVGANLAWTTGNLLDSVIGTDETPNSTQPTINAADPWKDKDRLNILILGGDSGNDRPSSEGDRTDTVIVASIDTHTGATTLFTLPRNTEKMPFPKNSPLSKYYPNGFTSGSSDLYTRSQFLLNAMYRVVPTVVPHDVLGKTKDFGASVMKVSVGYALGLPIDYFVKVNMDGFKDFINAIGGITVNINYKVPIGGQTDAGIKPEGYLKPGANQHLNGRLALWYARGRYGLDDYKRMERQRCVINAVVQQTTPATVLANFQSIAAAGEKTITTDVPRSLLTDLVDLGVKVKGTKLRSVVFDPDNGFNSPSPDWAKVRKQVQKALKETADGVTETASPSTTKKHKKKSDDLEQICAYHPES
ncbi:LCP family protein [Propionicimonas sp.]|uniref:LCP family glycopolymer transferase n=1 Tax=Propionicimonas sp. TaxID=1955623 RepID=UPI0039E33120